MDTDAKKNAERDARLHPPRYTLQLAQAARGRRLLKTRGRRTAGHKASRGSGRQGTHGGE